MNGDERPYLLELVIAVLLSVLFAAVLSGFIQGFSMSQKILLYAFLTLAIIGLMITLGSVRGWHIFSVYSLIIPCSKMLELDRQWGKVTKSMSTSVFSLPKKSKLFPEVWFHKNVENRSIGIFSRSTENLDFVKDKSSALENIKLGKESIFRHIFFRPHLVNSITYGYDAYRRYLVKVDWEDLRKMVTPFELELTEHYKRAEITIKKKKLKKESSLNLKIHLKHGKLMTITFFDDSSNVHVLFSYFEDPSRHRTECQRTAEGNWNTITNFLEKVLGNKYVIKEKASTEMRDEMVNGERYLVIKSKGSVPEFLQ